MVLFLGISIQFVVLHIFDPRQLQQFLLRCSLARRCSWFQNFKDNFAVSNAQRQATGLDGDATNNCGLHLHRDSFQLLQKILYTRRG